MFKFNFDRDIVERVATDLRPNSEEFTALPISEQMKRMAPYVQAQEARDRERLHGYRVAA